jgi:hypothetical protein
MSLVSDLRRFTSWGLTRTRPLFHAPDLQSSLCKKIIETLFLTEMIAPPTMTDETELAIADVTSLHEFPAAGLRRWSRYHESPQ